MTPVNLHGTLDIMTLLQEDPIYPLGAVRSRGSNLISTNRNNKDIVPLKQADTALTEVLLVTEVLAANGQVTAVVDTHNLKTTPTTHRTTKANTHSSSANFLHLDVCLTFW